jgi:hypothetical protein
MAHDPPLSGRRGSPPLSQNWKLARAAVLAFGLVALVIDRQASASPKAP